MILAEGAVHNWYPASHMYRILVALIAMLSIHGLVFGQFSPAKIRVGDEISVFLYDDSTLTGSYVVQSDGAIYLPRIGRFGAAGKTAEQLQSLVLTKVKTFLKDPIMTVSLRRQRPQSVFLIGGASGQLDLFPETDLRSLFAQAKVGTDPDLLQISVFRGAQRLVQMNASDLLSSQQKSWNGPIQPNDIIIIEPKPFVRVWVLGTVKNPGRLRMDRGDDIYKAIALAGDIVTPATGIIPQRSELNVTVRRGPDTMRFPLVPNPTASPFVLEDGDTISVQPPPKIRVTFAGESRSVGESVFSEGIHLGSALSATGMTINGTARRVALFRNGQASIYDASTRPGEPVPSLGPELQQGDIIFVPYNERAYFVFGEVQKPGRYPMIDNRTYHLADAIGDSGGASQSGSVRHITVARPTGQGKFQITSYKLDEFLKGGKVQNNPVIEEGDVVYVNRPNGLGFSAITQALSSALYLQAVTKL